MSLSPAPHFKPSEAYQENYCTIPIYIAAEMLYSRGQEWNDTIMQAHWILQHQHLAMSEDSRMIGNQGGFGLFQFMDEMRHKIDEQNRKLDEQNRKMDEQTEINIMQRQINEEQNQKLAEQDQKLDEQSQEMNEYKQKMQKLDAERFLNRTIELVKNSPAGGYLYIEDREERNGRVHGADIEHDLETLEWTQKNYGILLHAAEEGFEVLYDLTASEIMSRIPTAPKDIIGFLNKRCNLNHLFCYTRSKHSKQEISDMKQICKDIIDSWKNSVVYPTDEMQAKISKYQLLHGIWEEGDKKRREAEKEEEEEKKETKPYNKGNKRRNKRRGKQSS